MSADGTHQVRVARMAFVSMEGTFKGLVFVVLDSVRSKDTLSIIQLLIWSKMSSNLRKMSKVMSFFVHPTVKPKDIQFGI